MPDYQCLWLGSSWSCMWFSYVLASDHHLALCFVSLQSVFDYMCFTVMFHRWGRGPLCRPDIHLVFGAASELRVRFCTSKTGLRPPSPLPHPAIFPDHSKFMYISSFICYVNICSSSLLLLVPWEAVFYDCDISWISSPQIIFISLLYIIYTFLFGYNTFGVHF